MKNWRRGLAVLLIVLLLGVVAYSGYQIYSIKHAYKVGEETYASIAKQYVAPNKPPISDLPDEDEPDNSEADEPQTETPPIRVDFAALWELNPDIVGWIYCEDTPISYPVLQSGDNSYYLRRLPNGKYNVNGSIFMDYRNSAALTDENTLLYGHSLLDNNEMFTSLADYMEQSYYDAHPVLYYLTPETCYRVLLFSGYETNASADAYTVAFRSEAEFAEFLEKISAASAFQSDVTPTAQDRILTLSTCTNETSDGRYVVHGILRELNS